MDVNPPIDRPDTSDPCGRCAPHGECRATQWCGGCVEWMCVRCWWACNIGPVEHGGAGLRWNAEAEALVRSKGPQADGSYILFCGIEGEYAHADGGGCPVFERDRSQHVSVRGAKNPRG